MAFSVLSTILSYIRSTALLYVFRSSKVTSSIKFSNLKILFLASIFQLISNANAGSPSSRDEFLREVCFSWGGSKDFEHKFCQPKDCLVTRLFTLAISIMQTRVTNSTNMLAYIEQMLKREDMESRLKDALNIFLMLHLLTTVSVML